jgi:Tfp pilus assembly protein PilF
MATELIDQLSQQAQQAIAQGKNNEAQDFYRQALGLEPDNPQVHYGMGTVCFLLGDQARAAYHFQEVTRLDPQSAGGFINLGAVYNQLEQWDRAIPALVRGIQLDRNRFEGHYNLGLIYQRKQQFDLALQAFREARRANPRLAEASCRMAAIYVEKRQYAQAIELYRQALEIRPNWEKALRGLEQAENAKAPSDVTVTVRTGADASGGGSPGTMKKGVGAALDPNRLVDPLIHEELLRALHIATAESEKTGRRFLKNLEEQIEPAIKRLSNVFVTLTSYAVLDSSMKAFEAGVADMRAAGESLRASTAKVRQLGQQLLQS